MPLLCWWLLPLVLAVLPAAVAPPPPPPAPVVAAAVGWLDVCGEVGRWNALLGRRSL